jgi:hypothetical protein
LKRNLQRYIAARFGHATAVRILIKAGADVDAVGLGRLNQVDPLPITYSLSNP